MSTSGSQSWRRNHRHFDSQRGSCKTAEAHLLLKAELADPVGKLLTYEVGLQAGLVGAGRPTAGPTAGALLQQGSRERVGLQQPLPPQHVKALANKRCNGCNAVAAAVCEALRLAQGPQLVRQHWRSCRS